MADNADNPKSLKDTLVSLLVAGTKMLVDMSKEIVSCAVDTTKMLADMSKATATYASDLNKLSAATGASTEDLQAYSYAVNQLDVSMDTLAGSMSNNIESMSAARSGNDEMRDAYESLGVAISETDGSMRKSSEVYWEVIDALSGISSETERDALAIQLFGKSAQELNPLINEGTSGLKMLTDEAQKMGVVLSEASIDKATEFKNTTQQLEQVGIAAQNSLGMILIPSLNTIGTEGVKLLGSFAKGMNDAGGDATKMGEVITKTLGSLLDDIPGILEEIVSSIFPLVSGIVTAISESIPTDKLGEAMNSIINTLLTGLTTELPTIIEGAATIVASIADGISQALPTLVPAIVNVLTTIIQSLLDNLPMLLDAGLELIVGLADGILKAIPELIKSLPEIINALIKFFYGAIPQIIETGITLLTSIVDNLPDIIDSIVSVIPLIITGIIDSISESIPKIIDAGFDLIVALVTDLPKIKDEIVSAVPEIIKGIVDAFGSYARKIKDIGGNLLKGIWDGIMQFKDWLWEKVSGFFDDFLGNIFGFFDIKSPSAVMRDLVGKNLVLGLADGIDENSGTAVDAAEKLADDTLAAVIGIGEELNSVPDFDDQNEAMLEQGMIVAEKLGEGIDSGKHYIKNELEGVLVSFQELFRKNDGLFTSTGKNIMSGIGNGIISMSEWLNSLLRNYIDNMIYAVESRLGISSPSKVFAEVGGNMAKGIGVGFTDAMNGIKREISNAIPIPQAVSSGFGGRDSPFANPSNMNGGNVFNSTLNFYTKTVTPSDLAKASRRASEQMLRYAT